MAKSLSAIDKKSAAGRSIGALRGSRDHSTTLPAPCLPVHRAKSAIADRLLKAAIIDDEWLTVGSANLNNRGLVTDSELNAVVRDPAIARGLRIALWAEHLALPRDEVARADPIDLMDQVWAHRARQNAERVNQGDDQLVCPAHRYEVGRMPGAWLLDEIEALTFDL